MIIADPEGSVALVGGAIAEMFGWSPDALIGQPLETILPTPYGVPVRTPERDWIRQATASGPNRLFARHRDGSGFAVQVSAADVRGRGAASLSLTLSTVPGRTSTPLIDPQSEDEPRAVDRAPLPTGLRRFFDLSLDMMCIARDDGYFEHVSAAFATLGYTDEELTGHPFVHFVHPDDVAATLQEVEKLARGLPTVRFRNRYRRADGTYRWLEWMTTPDGHGRLCAIARDVTETRQQLAALVAAEQETAQLSAFLDAILENLPHMVFVKDAEHLRFVRVNRACEAVVGLSRAEMIGKSDDDFFPPEQARAFRDADRHTLRSGGTTVVTEEPIDGADGRRWLRTTKLPVVGADGTPEYLLGISEDITDRKRADALEQRLGAVVRASADAIVVETLDNEITHWNGAASCIFGYAEGQMIGRDSRSLIPEDHRAVEASAFARAAAGQPVAPYESKRVHATGRQLEVSVSLTPVERDGEVTAVSSTTRDTTEAKRVEEALRDAKTDAESANAELEAFSYSVAHELRAPLRAISGFSAILVERHAEGLDDVGRARLLSVRSAAQRMDRLVEDLLRLARHARSSFERSPVDLGELARGVANDLRESEPGRQVDININGDNFHVRGDTNMLRVVLENLLSNAWKYTRNEPHARVEFRRLDDETFFVRDNGAGFDMRYVDKLFGVFQRLHAASSFEGTGVGLATVLRIIRRHGGEVWAEGAVDQGATFYFTLPQSHGVDPPEGGSGD
jgi:PAS domain S-box-containing protein